MTTNDEQLDEVQVILDVEIGHGICPDDETNDTCKLIKVARIIKADREQAVLAARIDQVMQDFTSIIVAYSGTDDEQDLIKWRDARISGLQQASQKGTQ